MGLQELLQGFRELTAREGEKMRPVLGMAGLAEAGLVDELMIRYGLLLLIILFTAIIFWNRSPLGTSVVLFLAALGTLLLEPWQVFFPDKVRRPGCSLLVSPVSALVPLVGFGSNLHDPDRRATIT